MNSKMVSKTQSNLLTKDKKKEKMRSMKTRQINSDLTTIRFNINKSNDQLFYFEASSWILEFALCLSALLYSRILSLSYRILTLVLSQFTAIIPSVDYAQVRPYPTPTLQRTYPLVQSITVNYCSIKPAILLPPLTHPHSYPSSMLYRFYLSSSE